MKILSQASCLALLGAGLAAVPVTQAVAARTAPAAPGESLVQQMKTQAQGPVAISPEPATGKVGFVRVARTGDLSPSDTARTALGAADKAGDYLSEYATAFGATPDQLHETSVRSSSDGTTVTFEQVHRGVPVFGSMLRAHLDTQGDLTSVNGYAAPDVDISVTPRLSAGQAAARAVRAVRADPPSHNGGKADTTGLRAASTDLVIYRTGAIRGVAGSSALTYAVEVTNRSNIRDMVFVDANAGKLLNRYSIMDHALNRRVFEQQFTPAAEVWREGDPFPGDLNEDQQNIVLGSGEAYWLFRNAFGRDSYDGQGHRMNTVNNDPTIACPNANWNGTTTNYCNGVTSDDTVAHEWAHAYTEHTSNLIYQFQSGALNESYSDIWGETVDMVNGRQDQGDDTTRRPVGLCSTQTRGDVRLVINSPAEIAGPCNAAPAAFGPIIDRNGVTDDVVVGRDARGPDDTATNGCDPFNNANDIAGGFVYVDRGFCTFQTKADNATAADARGIIVGNNVPGEPPFQMTATADIYGVMIGLRNGEKIKSAPPGTVNVTIRGIGTAERVDSFRWLSGEGDPAFGGAIRDMWSPRCYGDPAKVSDAEYHCSTDDSGGVHTNSGVPNHAFSLLVDGGTFNGVSRTGHRPGQGCAHLLAGPERLPHADLGLRRLRRLPRRRVPRQGRRPDHRDVDGTRDPRRRRRSGHARRLHVGEAECGGRAAASRADPVQLQTDVPEESAGAVRPGHQDADVLLGGVREWSRPVEPFGGRRVPRRQRSPLAGGLHASEAASGHRGVRPRTRPGPV